MIPDETIQQIRDATDIVAVIGQHVQLRKAGRNWKGLCPFHGEKTPSFNVQPEKGFFHCFGCQKRGDAINFIMEMEGKSFIEALEQLAARANITIEKRDEDPAIARARGERRLMQDINKIAAAFYRAQLSTPAGEAGRAYLVKRGVKDEIAEKFQLGYAPAEWSLLAEHLREKRVDMELAVKVGLLAHRTRQGGFYDRNRDRLVCPVIEPGGVVAGFSSRLVGTPQPAPDGSEPPKYINSPESAVYKKSKLLFGLAQARDAMATQKRAVLVEGNFDVITLHQAGFAEVVAPLGTALTIEQVTLLKRLTERVVLLYDGDKAGYKATMHALQVCVEADVEVLVARRPGHGKSGGAGPLADGADPDSMVAGGGAEILRESVDRAMGGIEFFAFEVWSKARNNSDAKTRALEDAARLVAKVASPLKRDLMAATLATAMGVDVGVVGNAIRRAMGGPTAPNRGYDRGPERGGGHPNAPGQPSAQTAGTSSSGTSGEAARARGVPSMDEVEVIALFADHPQLIATPDADKAFWLLTDARLRDMYSAAREGQSLPELVLVQLPKTTAEHVLSGKYAETKDPQAKLAEMTKNLGLRSSVAGLQDTASKLKDAGRSGDRERARLFAQLGVAERKNDREEIERLKALLAEAETSSGKQDD